MKPLSPRSLRGWFTAGVLGTACLAAVVPARAQVDGVNRVALVIEACEPSFATAVRRIVRIELGDLLLKTPPGGGADGERMLVVCEPEVARISAQLTPQALRVDHDVRFDAFPGDAAPRAVALAALEALWALDPELLERVQSRRPEAAATPSASASTSTSTSPSPSPSPSTASVTASSRAVERGTSSQNPGARPPRRLQVALGGSLRLFLAEPLTPAWGGRAELIYGLGKSWSLGADGEVSFSRRRVDLGTLDAQLLSTSGWGGPRFGSDALSATPAFGARIGVANLRGAPSDATVLGRHVVRAWGGPALLGRLDGRVGVLSLALVAEFGIAVLSTRAVAGEATGLAIEGGWLSASVNAGHHF